MRRGRMKRGKSKRLFKARSGHHKKNNMRSRPMRGGIRL